MGIRESLNFCCVYSEKDHLFWNELRSHLSVLRRQGLINEWREETCEDKEKKEDYLPTKDTDILIWLISPSFVSSGYLERLEEHASSETLFRLPSVSILLPPPKEESDKRIPQPLKRMLYDLSHRRKRYKVVSRYDDLDKSDKWIPQSFKRKLYDLSYPYRVKLYRVMPGYDDIDQECYALTRAIFPLVRAIAELKASRTSLSGLDETRLDEKGIG